MKRKRLIKVLIHFHRSNLIRDWQIIDAVEMEKRNKVITGLRAMIAEKQETIKPKHENTRSTLF